MATLLSSMCCNENKLTKMNSFSSSNSNASSASFCDSSSSSSNTTPTTTTTKKKKKKKKSSNGSSSSNHRCSRRNYGDVISASTFTLLGITLVIPELGSTSSYIVITAHVIAIVVGFWSFLRGGRSSSNSSRGRGRDTRTIAHKDYVRLADDEDDDEEEEEEEEEEAMIHCSSILSTICNAMVISSMVILQFPVYQDSPLVEMQLWLFIMLNANLEVPQSLQIRLGVFLGLLGISIATWWIPETANLDKSTAVLTIAGVTLMHTALHSYMLYSFCEPPGGSENSTSSSSSIDKTNSRTRRTELITMHGARIVLAGVFVYNLVADVQAIQRHHQMMTENTGSVGTSIAALVVKAGFVFAVGLTAIGAFTKQIQQQDKKLHMFGLALQASQTAIAITNSRQQIIWLNPALARLTGKPEMDLQHQSIFNVLSLTDPENDKARLSQIFQQAKAAATTTAAAQPKDASYASQLHQGSSNQMKFKIRVRGNSSTGNINNNSSINNKIMTKVGDNDSSIVVVNAEVSSLALNNIHQHPHIHECRYYNSMDDDEDLYVVALKDVTEAEALKMAQKTAERDALMAQAMKESMETLTHELRTPLQGIMGICSMMLCDSSGTAAPCSGISNKSVANQQQTPKVQLPEEAKESLDLIMASSSLLLVLINNLLDVRKCDASMMDDFQLTPIPSSAPMSDAADFCRPLAKISGVEIDIPVSSSSSSMIVANTLRLQQVLINLISNGIKYTPHGGTIRVESRVSTLGEIRLLAQSALASGRAEDGDNQADHRDSNMPFLIISVSDCGPGIAPGQKDRMFRKFAQLETPTVATPAIQSNINMDTTQKKKKRSQVGQPGGTGLGLNLCLRFVQLMKGKIWVNNNADGPGATFSFCLPMASSSCHYSVVGTAATSDPSGILSHHQLQKTMPIAKTAPLSESSVTGASDLRVLVVDDILINRKVLHRMLVKIGVKSVEVAESGEDALAKLEHKEFDLIISDLQMPGGMSGLELSETIRKMEFQKESSSKRPNVVGLTADTSPDLYGRCLESGMVDVIHKPITVCNLSETLARWR